MTVFRSALCITLLVAIATTLVMAEEALPVSVSPSTLKKATGSTAELKCKTTLNTTLEWKDADGNVIPKNETYRVHVMADLTLRLQRLELNDTGEYTCFSADGAHNATSVLTIFIMPDYFLEGMIILIINIVLILVFFACLAHSLIQQKRNRSKQHKTEQKQTL